MELTVTITPRVAAQVARRLKLAASLRSRSMPAMASDAVDEAVRSPEEIRMQLALPAAEAAAAGRLPEVPAGPAGRTRGGRGVSPAVGEEVVAPAGDRARRWEPFKVTKAGFAAAPERDEIRDVNLTPGGQGPGGDRGGRRRARRAGRGRAGREPGRPTHDGSRGQADRVVAACEVAIPKPRAVVFAARGMTLAAHGERALRSRALNVACIGSRSTATRRRGAAGGTLGIWVMAATVCPVVSDTLIGVVRAWVRARARYHGEALAGDGGRRVQAAGRELTGNRRAYRRAGSPKSARSGCSG